MYFQQKEFYKIYYLKNYDESFIMNFVCRIINLIKQSIILYRHRIVNLYPIRIEDSNKG